MPITRKEFAEKNKARLIPVLKFLYDNKDKAYTLRELYETGLIGESNDFMFLVRTGYVDIGVDRTQANSEDYYFIITEKGIKYMMEKK